MPLPENTSIHFIDLAIIPPGTSVGEHRHEYSTEIYLILEGKGEYLDNDKWIKIKSGDVLINHRGRHSLVNNGDNNIRIFVIEAKSEGNLADERQNKKERQTGNKESYQ